MRSTKKKGKKERKKEEEKTKVFFFQYVSRRIALNKSTRFLKVCGKLAAYEPPEVLQTLCILKVPSRLSNKPDTTDTTFQRNVINFFFDLKPARHLGFSIQLLLHFGRHISSVFLGQGFSALSSSCKGIIWAYFFLGIFSH